MLVVVNFRHVIQFATILFYPIFAVLNFNRDNIMSIIQTIRDKGAAIVIGVIALSLIGFLLMDARSGAGKGLFGGGNNKVIGSVNGEDIDVDEFNAKVKIAEEQYQNSAPRPQIMQTVWDQMIGEKLLTDQFDKLGLTFTPQEMSSIIL